MLVSIPDDDRYFIFYFSVDGAGVRPPTRSWSSLRSSASRPPSRRLAKHIQSPASLSSCHVPVDQVLFLTRRIRSRVKGNAVLVTSEAGVAKFWDIFGYKKPVGA